MVNNKEYQMLMSKRSAVGQPSQTQGVSARPGSVCVYPWAGGGERSSGNVDRVGISFIIALWRG